MSDRNYDDNYQRAANDDQLNDMFNQYGNLMRDYFRASVNRPETEIQNQQRQPLMDNSVEDIHELALRELLKNYDPLQDVKPQVDTYQDDNLCDDHNPTIQGDDGDQGTKKDGSHSILVYILTGNKKFGELSAFLTSFFFYLFVILIGLYQQKTWIIICLILIPHSGLSLELSTIFQNYLMINIYSGEEEEQEDENQEVLSSSQSKQKSKCSNICSLRFRLKILGIMLGSLPGILIIILGLSLLIFDSTKAVVFLESQTFQYALVTLGFGLQRMMSRGVEQFQKDFSQWLKNEYNIASGKKLKLKRISDDSEVSIHLDCLYNQIMTLVKNQQIEGSVEKILRYILYLFIMVFVVAQIYIYEEMFKNHFSYLMIVGTSMIYSVALLYVNAKLVFAKQSERRTVIYLLQQLIVPKSLDALSDYECNQSFFGCFCDPTDTQTLDLWAELRRRILRDPKYKNSMQSMFAQINAVLLNSLIICLYFSVSNFVINTKDLEKLNLNKDSQTILLSLFLITSCLPVLMSSYNLYGTAQMATDDIQVLLNNYEHSIKIIQSFNADADYQSFQAKLSDIKDDMDKYPEGQASLFFGLIALNHNLYKKIVTYLTSLFTVFAFSFYKGK